MSYAEAVNARNAIHAWVVTTSGVSAGSVIWTDQGAPRPTSGPWVSINMLSSAPVGQPWIVDGASGADILRTCGRQFKAQLSVQVFGAAATDISGSPSGLSILSELSNSSFRESTRATLLLGGVTVLRMSPIRNMSGVVNSVTFEPRAQVDIDLLLVTTFTETIGTIESVEVTNDGDTITIPAP